MSNVDTMNSKSNLDCISGELFTELAPEAAAVVQGGRSFRDENISFYNDYTVKRERGSSYFYVPKGGSIRLLTNTKSTKGYRRFSASIVNTRTRASNTKTVDIGADYTTWTNVRGGYYQIRLQDPDSDRIYGNATVSYG